jgi:hypothetical protein
VFEILWGFLKIASRREDRLPFLNSFQLLKKEIRQPIRIIRFLLGDFVVDPSVIFFPDRNGSYRLEQNDMAPAPMASRRPIPVTDLSFTENRDI